MNQVSGFPAGASQNSFIEFMQNRASGRDLSCMFRGGLTFGMLQDAAAA